MSEDEERPSTQGQPITTARARGILALAEAVTASKPEDLDRHVTALLAVAREVAPSLESLCSTDPEAALRLAGGTSLFWQDAGLVDEGRRVVELALAAAGPAATVAGARATLTASDLAFRQGDQPTAIRRATEAIALAEQVGDRRTSSIGHANLARVAFRDGDATEIERHARRALEVAGDDFMGRRGALHMLAWAAHTAGDLPEARRRFETSLAFRRTLGDRFSVAVELSNLGDLSAEEGDLAAGAEQLAEALHVGHELGSRYLIVNLLPSFAALAARTGDDASAGRLLGAAAEAAHSSGLIADPGSFASSTEAGLRERVDPADFAQMLDDGRTLTQEEAVELALKVAGAIA